MFFLSIPHIPLGPGTAPGTRSRPTLSTSSSPFLLSSQVPFILLTPAARTHNLLLAVPFSCILPLILKCQSISKHTPIFPLLPLAQTSPLSFNLSLTVRHNLLIYLLILDAQDSLTSNTAGPFEIDDAKRQELVQTIIDDVTKSNSSGGKKTRLTLKGVHVLRRLSLSRDQAVLTDSASPHPDVYLALQAVKSLGKNPAGGEVIASTSNLSTLLTLSNAFKNDNIEASNEALRCIANALLLIDVARVRFVQKEVNGGENVLELLEVYFIAASSFRLMRF